MDYPILTIGQLSAHLRSLRKALHLTQTQLGLRVGLSQSRIGKMERNPAVVSVGEFLKIITALNVLLVLRAPTEPPPALPDSAPAAEIISA
jgi:HTH-type transcriptional regulator / antitoxin HipB